MLFLSLRVFELVHGWLVFQATPTNVLRFIDSSLRFVYVAHTKQYFSMVSSVSWA